MILGNGTILAIVAAGFLVTAGLKRVAVDLLHFVAILLFTVFLALVGVGWLWGGWREIVGVSAEPGMPPAHATVALPPIGAAVAAGHGALGLFLLRRWRANHRPARSPDAIERERTRVRERPRVPPRGVT